LRSFAHFALFDEFFPPLAARPRTGRIAPERTSPTHFAKRVDARVRCRAIFRERYFYGLFFALQFFAEKFPDVSARRFRSARPCRRLQRCENIFAKLLTSQKHVISFRPKQPHTCGSE
jgi:hypothetical protein